MSHTLSTEKGPKRPGGERRLARGLRGRRTPWASGCGQGVGPDASRTRFRFLLHFHLESFVIRPFRVSAPTHGRAAAHEFPAWYPEASGARQGFLESSCCASYSHQSTSDQKLWLLVNPRETLRETKVKTGRLSTKLWVPRTGRRDPGAQDAEPRCSPRTQGRGTRGQSGGPRGSGERARAECRWPRGARDHG